MAVYRLHERHNIVNEVTPISTTISQIETVNAAICKIAADVLSEELTINTSINGGTPFTMASKGITSKQLMDWAVQAADLNNKYLSKKLYFTLFDEAAFINLVYPPTSAAEDNAYINVVRRNVWKLVKRFGENL